MSYPKINNDPELLKVKTRDDEMKDMKYKTEKYDHENIIKSLKIDKDHSNQNYSKRKKKKIFITTLKRLTSASGLAVGRSLTVTGVGASIGVPVAGCTSILPSVATLFTNEYFSKFKLRYTKLKDWIKMVAILKEKTLNKSMIGRRVDGKNVRNLKKI